MHHCLKLFSLVIYTIEIHISLSCLKLLYSNLRKIASAITVTGRYYINFYIILATAWKQDLIIGSYVQHQGTTINGEVLLHEKN